MRLHKLVTSITIFLLLSGIFMGLAQFPQAVKAESENWLTGWGYRKSLIVSTGIHVITVHYGSGTDVLGHTYVDGKCQTDFDDIRFTSSDGETPVADVTVRAKVDGNYAEFKVNVVNSPIYMYYGESSVTWVYVPEPFGSGTLGDTDVLTQHYNVTDTSRRVTGIARVSPVTGFVTSLEAEISSYVGSTAQMALLLVDECLEEIDGAPIVYGSRIIAVTETKSIPVSDKHREEFFFDTPIPIFKGTKYGIALWGGIGTTIWYQTGTGTDSFRVSDVDFSGDMLPRIDTFDTFAYGRFMNYVQVDEDEQNILFRDNADYTHSRSMWHHHWEYNGRIDVAEGQGICGSYAFNSTITAPSGKGWGELSFLGDITDGNKRFWSAVVRLSDLPALDSHVELIAMLRARYDPWVSINGFGVNRTETGVQWLLSAKSGAGVWSHTLFGEVEVNTDYLVILSYETDSVDATSEIWVTKLSEPVLLEEASPSESLTLANDVFGDLFFIGAADYPLDNVSPVSVFFDEIALTENFPTVFGAWGTEEIFPKVELHLFVGWNMISFPVIPEDTSFSNIFNEAGFYQVLTWDGTSYVSPSVAEAGVGYWVLVLEETTVTVEDANPVTSYTKSLATGWSMIGSIYGKTVNAGDVFPGFYQLLTWDGTSYVSSTVIEPGKGYWALVLETTSITVTN